MRKQQLGFGLESLKDSKFTPMSNAAMQNITGGTIYGSGPGKVGGATYDHDMVTTYEGGKVDREYMNKDGSIAAPGNCGGQLGGITK